MKLLSSGRPSFVDGYERMAYITLEVAFGQQTQAQLAERLKLSPQRVSQIVAAGYARAGCRSPAHCDNPTRVQQGLAVATSAPCEPNTPEWFFKHERFGSYQP